MLKLEDELFREIEAHAAEAYPEECCGALLGVREDGTRIVTRIMRCRNVHAEPRHRYSIDPAELISIQREGREAKLEIVGFYHSHPDHPATASPTDLAEANWTGCSYLIVSVEARRIVAVRSYVLEESGGTNALNEEAAGNATVA